MKKIFRASQKTITIRKCNLTHLFHCSCFYLGGNSGQKYQARHLNFKLATKMKPVFLSRHQISPKKIRFKKLLKIKPWNYNEPHLKHHWKALAVTVELAYDKKFHVVDDKSINLQQFGKKIIGKFFHLHTYRKNRVRSLGCKDNGVTSRSKAKEP